MMAKLHIEFILPQASFNILVYHTYLKAGIFSPSIPVL